MTIRDMHKGFRALGQQMGLQLVRAILPESIDIYLNASIIEWARRRIISNVDSVYNDKVTIQRNDISPINGVRSLYKNNKVSAIGFAGNNGSYLISLQSVNNVMFYTSFEVVYNIDELPYGCRFIERDKLSNTLRDYCNGPSSEYPIACMHSDDEGIDVIELYFGKDNVSPKELVVHYIAMPDIVKLGATEEDSVNCNLPEYAHQEIVEMAVNKFFHSVGSTNNTVSAQ